MQETSDGLVWGEEEENHHTPKKFALPG